MSDLCWIGGAVVKLVEMTNGQVARATMWLLEHPDVDPRGVYAIRVWAGLGEGTAIADVLRAAMAYPLVPDEVLAPP